MLARPTTAAARLIPALDTADAARAEALAAVLAPRCGALKLGLELFTAEGPAAMRAMTARAPVFLDLKLHDIPNTVAGAVRALLPLRPAMLTLHAAGGAAMIAAAREAAEAAGAERPIILAVTVLTSIDAATLAETGVIAAARCSRCCGSAGWRWRPAPMGWSVRRRRWPAPRRLRRGAAAGGAGRPPGRQRAPATRRGPRPRPRRWPPGPTGSSSAGRSPARPTPAPAAQAIAESLPA